MLSFSVARFRFLVWNVTLFLCLHSRAGDAPLHLSCTTSHLACAAIAVGGTHVEVKTIIPFGMCPGHFDLNPREAQALADADLVLCHGFERFLSDVKAAQPEMKVVKVAIPGNWMVPEVQKAGLRAVADLLCADLPEYTEVFKKNLATAVQEVDSAFHRHMSRLKDVEGTQVICSSMNRDLVMVLGFEVLACFPRDEDISAKELVSLALRARKEGARLVVDNKQSSGKVGQTLADELKIPLVMLTNFPPESAGSKGYLEALAHNCTALVEAGGKR